VARTLMFGTGLLRLGRAATPADRGCIDALRGCRSELLADP
jgi:hypothetical protein